MRSFKLVTCEYFFEELRPAMREWRVEEVSHNLSRKDRKEEKTSLSTFMK